MPWNWELPDWPRFNYDPDRLSQLERQFLLGVGSAFAYLKTIDEEEHHRFIVEILSLEGLESSRIEGEILDRRSRQLSSRRHFGLSPYRSKMDKDRDMAQLLSNVYESPTKPLTYFLLWQCPRLLFKDRSSLMDWW